MKIRDPEKTAALQLRDIGLEHSTSTLNITEREDQHMGELDTQHNAQTHATLLRQLSRQSCEGRKTENNKDIKRKCRQQTVLQKSTSFLHTALTSLELSQLDSALKQKRHHEGKKNDRGQT